MKIKEFRTITEADKKKVPSGCGSTPAYGPDKPPS
jgi:hypothetical protein